MKIDTFQYENKAAGLKISPIDFNSDLTLLVGASGVGKTLILSAIGELIRIVRGASLNGVEWEIKFSSDKEHKYLWKGAFETIDFEKRLQSSYLLKSDDIENALKPKIIQELLQLNDEPIRIIERNDKTFKFKGTEAFPKPSSYKSGINLFADVDDIIIAYKGLNQINLFQNFRPDVIYASSELINNLAKYKTLDEIRNSDLSTYMKLFIVYKNFHDDIFKEIKENFILIFPQISDLSMGIIEPIHIPEPLHMPNIVDDNNYKFFLQIKEKDVEKWINPPSISMGMFKTLLLISERYLCNNETVILIDEFENSLGLNCIDAAVDNIFNVEQDLQFIITSHHPYIINNIDMNHWKVVSRKGGVISTKTARDLRLGESRHEAFKQLIQSPDYSKGINV
ncbi:MAG: ATP-binding protein [Nitrospirae bacterium]|nr:ATP-binding protein [Nitrospirota bacterium]